MPVGIDSGLTMPSSRLVLTAWLAACAGPIAAADLCPASLEIPSQQITVPDGWEAFKPASTTSYLQTATISVEHPRERMIIRPKDEPAPGGNVVNRWVFDKEHAYWVTCWYQGTNYGITKKIDFSRCVITYSARGDIQGTRCER